MPICSAVLKLITNSNLIGAATGNSAGFVASITRRFL